jgi:hypothetical protein
MCGGGGSPPPVDTYVGNGTKKGGALSPSYGHNPETPQQHDFETADAAPTNRMTRGGNTKSGIKM